MAEKAKSKEAAPGASPPRRTTAEWTEALGARRSFAAGAARMKGWGPDSEVSEAEFNAALRAFQKKPLGGPRAKPAEKIKTIQPIDGARDRPGSER